MAKEKVLVLGGGLAGVAAGYTLLKHAPDSFDVEILERGHVLGGKASSMRHGRDEVFEVDHGLHVFFDYPNLFKLLEEAGGGEATKRLIPSEGSHFYEDGGLVEINATQLPTPAHLLGGLPIMLSRPLDALPMARLLLAGLLLRPEKLPLSERRRLDETSFADFAAELGVSAQTLRSQTFRIAERATFNYPYPTSALAMLLSFRLTQQNYQAQKVRYIDGPTGEVIVSPLVKAFQKAGGKVHRYRSVGELQHDGARVSGLRASARPERWPHGKEAKSGFYSFYHTEMPAMPLTEEIWNADHYVSALPVPALVGLLDDRLRAMPYFGGLTRLLTQRTIAYQIYYDRVVTPADFREMVIATPGPFSTLLDRARLWSRHDGKGPNGDGSVIELVGEEGDLKEIPDEEVARRGKALIEELFPGAREAEIVREFFHRSGHDDYFMTTIGTDALRPTAVSPLENLFLAGDFTANGFGVVGMEGAVVSGIEAANAILARSGHRPRPVRPMSEPGGVIPLLRSALRLSGLFRTIVGYQESV